MSVAIHYAHGIDWHLRRIGDFSAGLDALGIDHQVTSSPARVSDVSVLFGTTLWRRIEQDDGPWMLVDRCSFGDSDQFVSLVWNGHGRRGDHMVPPWADESRWEAFGVEIWPQVMGHSDVVICGQTETYSPHWDRLEDWYASIEDATHFRTHPAGKNPTGLPEKVDWFDAKFHVLNSSVGVEAVLRGRPVEIHDEGCMAYGVEDVEEWAHWLAWTQWRWDEIRSGRKIAHLFGMI